MAAIPIPIPSLKIKTRVKSLLTSLQRDKGGDEEDDALDSPNHSTRNLDSSASPQPIDDARKIAEVLAEVDSKYYAESGVDVCEYELRNMGPEVNLEALAQRILVLKGQDLAIYKKIYSQVLLNYTAYVQELENVTALELALDLACRTAVNSRRQLRMAKEGVAHGGLGLLAKYRKRERLKSLLDVLQTFKTLQRAGQRLRELLEEGDYPSATQLCIKCQEAIETYRQFKCVSELAVSLQDIHTLIEDELEQALAVVATNFDPAKYSLVQDAYRILGKTQRAVDLLLMKFTSAIHDKAYAVVARYARGPSDSIDTKTQYANLCKLVQPENFICCLLDLCQMLWQIMHNFQQVRHWHTTHSVTNEGISHDEGSAAAGDDDDHNNRALLRRESAEIMFNHKYVHSKLENGLVRIWRDVQQKVRPYLQGADMSHFQYDSFIKVVGIINRLTSIGFDFCGEGAETLEEAMRLQSLSYFRSYHCARLDELRLFLESEEWVVCPVRTTFSVLSLREFRFMRDKSISPLKESSSFSRRSDEPRSVFDRFPATVNPFIIGIMDDEEEETEDVVIDQREADDAASDDDKDDGEEIPDELKKGYVDEQTGEVPAAPSTLRVPHYMSRQRTGSLTGPILANVTLTVVRFWGNYMQMMNVLHPIAFDVLEYLTNLFDYYLYAVYTFFAQDIIYAMGDQALSPKLSTSLKRINETLLLSYQGSSLSSSVNTDDKLKVPHPVTNPFLQLDNPASLFGLSFRVVAIESLVFLAKQFEVLVPQLESLIPEPKRIFLKQFFSQTVSPCSELRKPVYCAIASKGIPYDQVLQSMITVKWDVKEIMSQHSKYVDQLVQEFEKYGDMIGAIDRHVRIPHEARNLLWSHAIHRSCCLFVEGFAQAKKCSNEGRALMQLDFQQFRTKLEKMSSIRPLTNHSFVEDYIKAYYFSESDLEHWLMKHKEYSPKQLQALVMCGAGGHLNKKAKQRLLSSIDDQKK